jgi:AraC family transcriptional regulator
MEGRSASFQLFNELSEHLTLRISSCNLMRHPAAWSEKKQHPDYDLWLMLEGSVSLQMNGASGTAGPGDLILFYPGMPYSAFAGESGYQFLYIHFDFDLGDRPRILNEYELAGIVPGAAVAEEAELFRRCYERYRSHAIASSVRLKGSLTMLLSRIIEQAAESDFFRRHQLAQTSQAGDTKLKQMDTLIPVFDYLQNYLHQPIAIRELAEQINMSEKYFITYFRNIVGVTPGYYIYQLRMNRAREYLHLGTYSIKQIAERLGYPDPYAFSKAFKKYYNRPPSQFI